MLFFRKGWGENSSWCKFEDSIWMALIKYCDDCTIVKSLESQWNHVFQVFRYRTENGYRVRCVYKPDILFFGGDNYECVAELLSSKDTFQVQVFASGGMIAQFFINGMHISNPLKLLSPQWKIQYCTIIKPTSTLILPNGWVKRLHEEKIINHLRQPLNTLADKIDGIKLPEDFIYLSSLTDGCRIVTENDSYEILSESFLPHIPYEGTDYLALIDLREVGAICCRQGSPKLFFVCADGVWVINRTLAECIQLIASGKLTVLFDE